MYTWRKRVYGSERDRVETTAKLITTVPVAVVWSVDTCKQWRAKRSIESNWIDDDWMNE